MSPYLVVRHVFSTQASRPNAGADGLQKTHFLGGTERARISEQCLRRALLDGGIMLPARGAVGADPTGRGHVAERLAARGVSTALQRSRPSGRTVLSKGGGPSKRTATPTARTPSRRSATKVAVLAISGEEYDGLAEVAKRHLDAGTPTAKLVKALEKDLKKVLGGGAMSLDAKLFGRMVSGVPEARSTGCLGNTAAVGTHAVEDFLDTFVAVDRHAPLEHGSGAGHFDEKHHTGSVFVADWWLDEKLARDRDHDIDPKGTVEGLVRGLAGLVIRPLSGKTAVPLETIDACRGGASARLLRAVGRGVPVARRPQRPGRGRDAEGLARAPRPASWWAGLAALAGRGRPRPAAGYGPRRAPAGGVIGRHADHPGLPLGPAWLPARQPAPDRPRSTPAGAVDHCRHPRCRPGDRPWRDRTSGPAGRRAALGRGHS